MVAGFIVHRKGHHVRTGIRLLTGMLISGIAVSSCTDATPQACTPPMTYWQTPQNFMALIPKMNEVAVDHTGTLYGNGNRITGEKLSQFLTMSHRLIPEPTVFLQTEARVPCKDLDELRNRIDDALECKTSHQCAEGIESVWRALPSQPGGPVS